MTEITILTPTYNRGILLRNLYNSLINQTNKEFVWYIVDDGSNDITKELVNSFINEKLMNIQYQYKPNGGKHTAINLALCNITSKLTFIVDSDDILAEDAVEIILDYHNHYCNDRNICGYSFLRQFTNGQVNGKLFPKEAMVGSYIECRLNQRDYYADKAEVFLTSVLRQFPFPEYKGEKYVGEDLVWIRMALQFNMVHINKVIYIGDYLSDGLSKNRFKKISSPRGEIDRAIMLMNKHCIQRIRVKGALIYIIYSKFANLGLHYALKHSPYKMLTFFYVIPAQFIYLHMKRKYKKIRKEI